MRKCNCGKSTARRRYIAKKKNSSLKEVKTKLVKNIKLFL